MTQDRLAAVAEEATDAVPYPPADMSNTRDACGCPHGDVQLKVRESASQRACYASAVSCLSSGIVSTSEAPNWTMQCCCR